MGAKLGKRTKGNKQKAEYLEPGRNARETGWNGSGKARKSKDREAAPEKQLRGEAGKKRKGRNRKLSSRKRKRSGRKKAGKKWKIRK